MITLETTSRIEVRRATGLSSLITGCAIIRVRRSVIEDIVRRQVQRRADN